MTPSDPPIEHILIWWRGDPAGPVSELLAIGPGPSPLLHQASVRHAAITLSGPGAWAVASRISLGPLPRELAHRVRRPPPVAPATADGLRRLVMRLDGTVEDDTATGADDLYESCRRAALVLIACRLADPVCARAPHAAGVLAARLAGGGVELAPAIASDEGPPQTGLRLDPPVLAEVEQDTVEVALPGAERVVLPAVGWSHVADSLAIALDGVALGPLTEPRFEPPLLAGP